MVNRRRLAVLSVMGVFLVGLFSLSSIHLPSSVSVGVEVAQAQAPSPTPVDPVWIAFSAARSALEDDLKRNIQYVQSWEWIDTGFNGPISACRTLKEGEQARIDNFGYKFTITLLNGSTYEVRTSYDSTYVVICDGVTTTAIAAPQAPAAGLPAPVAGPVGRGGLELGGQGTGLFPEVRNAMNASGMRWFKVQAKGSQDMTSIINEAHGAGYKVLVSAVGDISSIMEPARQDAFAAYVGSLAKLGADAIEVWNEPNIEREWPAGQISGGNYTQLLAKSYNAIKQNNPNTIVISGAPAPTGFFGSAGCAGGGCNDDVFYQQMAAAGAVNFMDCVGIHYNEGIISPTRNTGDPRGGYPTYYYQGNVSRALSPFKNAKQGCFTEIGYLSPEGYGSLPGNFAWAANTKISDHAQWLGEAVAVAKAAGNIRLFIVFNINFTTYTDDPQAGYAIIRKDGSCPACSTLRAGLG